MHLLEFGFEKPLALIKYEQTINNVGNNDSCSVINPFI